MCDSYSSQKKNKSKKLLNSGCVPKSKHYFPKSTRNRIYRRFLNLLDLIHLYNDLNNFPRENVAYEKLRSYNVTNPWYFLQILEICLSSLWFNILKAHSLPRTRVAGAVQTLKFTFANIVDEMLLKAGQEASSASWWYLHVIPLG